MRRREFIPLLSYAAVVWPLTGLKVEARLDLEIYRKGRKVTERELKHLALSTHDCVPALELYPRCRGGADFQ